MIQVTSEVPTHRIYSRSSSSRDRSFANAVRARDQRSVIGDRVPDPDDLAMADFTSFHAAHIFPLASEALLPSAFADGAALEQFRMSVSAPGIYQTGIDSVRNGMLLSIELHILWDGYCYELGFISEEGN